MQPITIGSYQTFLKIRPNTRARNLILRLDGPHLMMTVPRWTTQKDVEKFLKTHELKILQMLAKHQTIKPYPTDQLTVLNKPYKIHLDTLRTKGVWVEEDILWIGGKIQNPDQILEQWLIQQAHTFFTTHATPHAQHLGRKISEIKIRDMKTRWGSCRSNGSITFSWRLLLAPQEVAEYVSIHEVCHLREMNHSPKFWKLVEEFCPNYKEHRRWLKTEGKRLSEVQLENFLKYLK